MADASSLRKASSLPSATGNNLSGVRYIDGELAISNGTNWFYPGRVEASSVGATADSVFYVATRPMEVVAIRQVHSVAGSDGSAVNVQVVKDTGTDAPGAGTNLLTNNSNAGFNLKATANTVQTGTLTSTAATKKLAAGDRLSVDFAGTLTDVAGVVVTVTLRPI